MNQPSLTAIIALATGVTALVGQFVHCLWEKQRWAKVGFKGWLHHRRES